MQEIRKRKSPAIRWHARAPYITRFIALVILALGIAIVAISYYRLRNNLPFRLRSSVPELSKQVTSVVEGYERRETDGDRLLLLVKAAREITFADGHHELEEVYIESYPVDSDTPNKVTAKRAIYDQENSRMTFTGDVNLETRDGLIAKTETVVYSIKLESAQTNNAISFERENVSGKSLGAVVDAKNKILNLVREVEITVAPDKTGETDSKGTTRSQPVTIRSQSASFNYSSLSLSFTGGATAQQGSDVMSGDTLSGTLNQQKRFQKIESRGNAYLRTMTTGRAAEASARQMDFFLDAGQQLERAFAIDDVRARSLDSDSEIQLTGAKTLEVLFAPHGQQSLLREMRANGRTTVNLSAPASTRNDPRSSSKRLIADDVKLFWRTNGRDVERAEAVGNAELFVEPVQKTTSSEYRILTAQRFDCDFYDSGNLARTFVATGGAKAVFEPVQTSEHRATRTITAQKISADFFRDTQDIERVQASGDARFNKRDLNGRAGNATYTTVDATLRLRGSEPTIWDSRARTKAGEIDTNTNEDISYSRGKTSTTYYSQEQTNGALPFSKVKSPVYITSDRAEFRHQTGVATYTGGARAWQEDNFVSADRITLYREAKKMDGEGNVKSALYNARVRSAGSSSAIPVFASSRTISYSEPERLLRYEGNVDLRQGADRITSNSADVYLLRTANDIEKTIARGNVVLAQPGRVGSGNWAQYTAADETFVLTGNPARVEDSEQGSTEGNRLTLFLRENRVVADGSKGPQSTGRVRSRHPVKKD